MNIKLFFFKVVNKWLKERKMIEDNVMVGDENGLQPGQYPVEGTDASSLQAEGRAIRVAGAGVEGDSEEVLDELPSPFQAEMKYCTLDFIEDPGKSRDQSTTVKKKGELSVRPIQCFQFNVIARFVHIIDFFLNTPLSIHLIWNHF